MHWQESIVSFGGGLKITALLLDELAQVVSAAIEARPSFHLETLGGDFEFSSVTDLAARVEAEASRILFVGIHTRDSTSGHEIDLKIEPNPSSSNMTLIATGEESFVDAITRDCEKLIGQNRRRLARMIYPRREHAQMASLLARMGIPALVGGAGTYFGGRMLLGTVGLAMPIVPSALFTVAAAGATAFAATGLIRRMIPAFRFDGAKVRSTELFRKS
jgi:hypothetical protein